MEKKLKIESGFQLFSRVTQRPTLDKLHPTLFPDGGPRANAIVQITGDDSTGKTLLMTELIAWCILPVSHENQLIRGKNSGAILINTDHHFNLFKLVSVMESILTNLKISPMQHVLKKSLKNLTILNCYSSEQIRLTFQNLEQILTNNVCVNFLAIDGILSQYWYDRVVSGVTSINMYCGGILNELKKVIYERKVVTLFTKPESEKVLYFCVNHTIHLKRVGAESFVAIVHNHDEKKRFSVNYVIDNMLKFDCS